MSEVQRPPQATIEANRPVFTLINTFRVTPTNQSALIDSLARVTEDFTRSLPGFLAAAVHRSLDGQVVINYVQWQRREDFDAMMLRPEMQAHLKEVAALASSISPVFCEVAYLGSRSVQF